jgi:Na+/glutamate symporter
LPLSLVISALSVPILAMFDLHLNASLTGKPLFGNRIPLFYVTCLSGIVRTSNFNERSLKNYTHVSDVLRCSDLSMDVILSLAIITKLPNLGLVQDRMNFNFWLMFDFIKFDSK